jgi:hypothetical protein
MSIKTGVNGTSFFDAVTQADKQLLIDASNAAENTFILRFRADKELSATDKLDEVIQLSNDFYNQNKSFAIIYTINLKEHTPASVVSAIATLKQSNVAIAAVEYGNEYYSSEQANFDFNAYKSAFAPYRDAIRASFPLLPHSIFLAPRASSSGVSGGRNNHDIFNANVFDYLKTVASPIDQVSVHIYYNANDCNVLTQPLEKRVFNQQVLDAGLQDYYTSLYNQSKESDLWDKTLIYIKNNTSAPINITEFGFDNTALYRNTLAYSAAMFAIWNRYSDQVNTLLIHNGVSLTTTSIINPYTPKFDVKQNDNINLPRLDYFTYKLFQDNLTFKGIKIPVYISYNDNPYNIISDGVVTDLNYKFLSGSYIYSGSGRTGWMDNGTIPSYEISNISNITTITNNTIIVPKLSFGYVLYTEKNIVLGCTDKLALNYNPDATTNDGSCYYITDCGCMDSKAANYNPNAKCKDNTKCVYTTPPPQPCKPDSRCSGFWYKLFHNSYCNKCK